MDEAMRAPDEDPMWDHVDHLAVRAVADSRPATARTTHYIRGRITRRNNNTTAITRATKAIVLVFMCASSGS